MAWIKTIEHEEAEGKLKTVYARVAGPNGQIDHILASHSLRPHSLVGHMTLYKNVLHHRDNKLPTYFLECIGVYVSKLNSCDYCFEHHMKGVENTLPENLDMDTIRAALQHATPADAFSDLQLAFMHYTKKLTLDPASMQEADVTSLKEAGASDGEILEVNQVAAYFSYANRTVLGLGVSINGEVLGTSPSNVGDGDDWSHR